MPHFDNEGFDTWICQICGQEKPGREISDWRPEITGHRQAGNVCQPCIRIHEETGTIGDALRHQVAYRRQASRPMSLHEHCRRESGGLTGPALHRYINRHYGHN